MKVYWTKNLTYDKKDLVTDFCEKYNLTKEWRKGTDNNKGHYNLLDLDEKKETAKNIQTLCSTEKIKTTNRSNNTAAMSKFKNDIYNLYQEGASFDNIIELIDGFIEDAEEKWHGKIDKSVALAHIEKERNKTNSYWCKYIEEGRNIFTGNGRVLLVGAYEDINARSKRLIEIAKFLEGIIDKDCLIYDDKGTIYFYTFNQEKANLVRATQYFKKPLLKLLKEEHSDYDEIFSFNKDDFTKILSNMKHDEGGGFIEISEGDNIAISFLRNIKCLNI